jgi:hypothetical protein
MRRACIGTALLCTTSILFGQTVSKATDSEPVDELGKVESLSASSPPELVADIALRSAALLPPGKRRERLETYAFQLAPQAFYRFQLAPVGPLMFQTMDSESGFTASALLLGLDTLSLQCRAVRSALDHNPAMARRLFESIVVNPPLLSCNTPLAYRPDIYFTVAFEVSMRGFTGEEKTKGEDVAFLKTSIGRVNHLAVLGPLVRQLAQANLSAESESAICTEVFGFLGRLESDSVTFLASAPTLIDSLALLSSKCEQRPLSQSPSVLQKAREIIVRLAQSPQCSDSQSGQAATSATLELIGKFNALASSGTSQPDQQVRTIDPSEVKPDKWLPEPQLHSYWTSPSERQLVASLRLLRFGPVEDQKKNFAGRKPDELRPAILPLALRERIEWQNQLYKFLSQLDNWFSEKKDDPIGSFYIGSATYRTLIELVPDQPSRRSLVRTFLAFLGGSTLKHSKPPEWILWTHRLLQSGDPGDQTIIREEMAGAADPTIAAYATLEKLNLKRNVGGQ